MHWIITTSQSQLYCQTTPPGIKLWTTRLAVLYSLTELLSQLLISTRGVKWQLSTVSMDFIDNQQGLHQFCKLTTMNKICNLSSLILIERINTKDLSGGTISGVSVTVVWRLVLCLSERKPCPGPCLASHVSMNGSAWSALWESTGQFDGCYCITSCHVSCHTFTPLTVP